MLRKTVNLLLLILNFSLIFFILSHCLDADFGWHLRFGQEALNGHFPYLDSYTYTFFGQPWVNHEWGSDLVFWLVYSRLGYPGTMFLTAGFLTLAMFLLQKYFQKIPTVLITSLQLVLTLALMNFLSVRSTILSGLFFALLIIILEKIAEQPKVLYLIPPLLWLWSTMHGSWILGFIVINIYLLANLFIIIYERYSPWPWRKNDWNKKIILKMLLVEVVSLVAIALNPYGLNLYQEIFNYFTQNYYKKFIIEWTPSYTYPIFFASLTLAATSAVFMVWGFLKKKATLAQLLLFFALFYAALIYKRNNYYLIIALYPILIITLESVWLKIEENFQMPIAKITKLGYSMCVIASILAIIFLWKNTSLTKDQFTNKLATKREGYPLAASTFLANKIGQQTAYIFNEFDWGGFLEWKIPQALFYFDGRGTATWLNPYGVNTMLEHYQNLKFRDPESLKEITNSPAQFIFLSSDYVGYNPPGLLDKVFFTQTDLEKLFPKESPSLITQLNSSPDWQKIYQDRVATVWQKTSSLGQSKN